MLFQSGQESERQKPNFAQFIINESTRNLMSQPTFLNVNGMVHSGRYHDNVLENGRLLRKFSEYVGALPAQAAGATHDLEKVTDVRQVYGQSRVHLLLTSAR
jgi:hypothetical protein